MKLDWAPEHHTTITHDDGTTEPGSFQPTVDATRGTWCAVLNDGTKFVGKLEETVDGKTLILDKDDSGRWRWIKKHGETKKAIGLFSAWNYCFSAEQAYRFMNKENFRVDYKDASGGEISSNWAIFSTQACSATTSEPQLQWVHGADMTEADAKTAVWAWSTVYKLLKKTKNEASNVEARKACTDFLELWEQSESAVVTGGPHANRNDNEDPHSNSYRIDIKIRTHGTFHVYLQHVVGGASTSDNPGLMLTPVGGGTAKLYVVTSIKVRDRTHKHKPWTRVGVYKSAIDKKAKEKAQEKAQEKAKKK